MIRIVAILAALLLTLSAQGEADAGWQLRKQGDGIRVFTRKVDGSAIDEVRAVADIAAPIADVEALLLDAGRRPQWDGMCRSARRVRNADYPGGVLVILYDMPWPVDDREMVMSLERQEKDGVVVLLNQAVAGVVPPNKKAVRIIHANASWTLKPLGESVTRLETTALVDPNGPIPAWLLNTLSVSQPFSMVTRLRELLVKN